MLHGPVCGLDGIHHPRTFKREMSDAEKARRGECRARLPAVARFIEVVGLGNCDGASEYSDCEKMRLSCYDISQTDEDSYQLVPMGNVGPFLKRAREAGRN